MFGAIVGDIVGSIYEWDNLKSKRFPFFSKKGYFTDDTVFTLAVAKTLMESAEQGTSLIGNVKRNFQTLGRQYPYAGWGSHQMKWIFSEDPKPYRSLGNGAGMRISPVAYVGQTLQDVIDLSDILTSVTHNHPEGIKGARAIAASTYLARTTKSKDRIRKFIVDQLGYDLSFTMDGIRPFYRYDVTAPGSTPQAIQAFLESESFEDAIRNAISIGGDSDTIAAMTGAIAGAYYGIPETIVKKARTYLPDDLLAILDAFTSMYLDR